jgi:hypothetical protein
MIVRSETKKRDPAGNNKPKQPGGARAKRKMAEGETISRNNITPTPGGFQCQRTENNKKHLYIVLSRDTLITYCVKSVMQSTFQPTGDCVPAAQEKSAICRMTTISLRQMPTRKPRDLLINATVCRGGTGAAEKIKKCAILSIPDTLYQYSGSRIAVSVTLSAIKKKP